MVLYVADVKTHPFCQQLVATLRGHDLDALGIALVPKQTLMGMGVRVSQLPFAYDGATGRSYEDVACVEEVRRRTEGHRPATPPSTPPGTPSWFPATPEIAPPPPQGVGQSMRAATPPAEEPPQQQQPGCGGGFTVRRDGNGKRKQMR